MRWCRRLAAAVLVVLLSTTGLALADEPMAEAESAAVPPPAPTREEAGFSGFSVHVDQDVFLDALGVAGNEDRNYTMGLAIQLHGSFVHDLYLDAPLRGLDWAFGVDRLHSEQSATDHGISLIGAAFTPDDLDVPEVIETDRPYSSIVGIALTRTSSVSDWAITSELNVVALGLRLGENIQTEIHQWLRKRGGTSKDPLGWGNQISDGFEPSLRYAVSGLKSLRRTSRYQVVAGGEASLGYYTNVAAIGAIRVGWFEGSYVPRPVGGINKISQFVPSDDKESDGLEPSDCFEAYVFLEAAERYWLYNALLQGQFRDSAHTLSFTETERFVREWKLGAKARVGRPENLNVGLTLLLAGRSQEFDLEQSRAHIWSGFSLDLLW